MTAADTQSGKIGKFCQKLKDLAAFLKCSIEIELPAHKVEIFLEQREVALLSPRKICENLNFSTEIQIFANFAV